MIGRRIGMRVTTAIEAAARIGTEIETAGIGTETATRGAMDRGTHDATDARAATAATSPPRAAPRGRRQSETQAAGNGLTRRARS